MRNRVNRERASLVTLTNGVLLLEAVFDRHVYERHMHDTYAVGVTLRGAAVLVRRVDSPQHRPQHDRDPCR
jgi:hypothetical protein